MAKNTTKKIKELKGIKPEKITDEQLSNVQSTINYPEYGEADKKD